MKKLTPIVIVVLVILIGGALLLKTTKKSDNSQTSQTADQAATNQDSSQTSSSSNSTCQTPPANTVVYCNDKFNDLTVPAGTVVTFRNDTSHAVQPDSDPHPAHTDDTELNVGFLNPGQSKTVTLTKKGTWGIHNHIREEETAKIIVQ